MHVLILNYEYPPLGGGAGNATKYLLQSFVEDDDLHITFVTSSAGKYRVERDGRITRHFLDIGKRGSLHYQSLRDLLVYSWKAFWYVRRLARTQSIDLIHAFFGIPCGVVAMALKKPYIVSLRGSDVPGYNARFAWMDRLLFRTISRVVWHRAECVVANSQDLKQLAHHTAPNQVIEVITNGVDTHEFAPVDERPEQPLTIISTSRLIERKGVRNLLEAVLLLRHQRDIRLIMVGDGNLRSVLEARVHEACADGIVTFYGALPHDELPELYRNADVLVLPSENEGMSNALLEAMASGLAIITTDTGGVSQIDSGGIRLIKDSDVQTIYHSLRFLDQQHCKRMGTINRARVMSHGWKSVADKYITLYRDCTKRSMTRIPLLYIVGSRHSGSTLIDQLIGCSHEVFSTGELAFYSMYANKQKHRFTEHSFICTCKEDFSYCPIWSNVKSDGPFQVRRTYRWHETMRVLLAILVPCLRTRLGLVPDDTGRILRSLRSIDGLSQAMFIDSSKDPRRLLHLSLDPSIDLRPIHLVRDGRAFAYSLWKKERETVYGMKRKAVIPSIAFWSILHIMTTRLNKSFKGVLLSYDAFCKHPDYWLDRLNKRYQIHIPIPGYIDARNNTVYHNIDGNIVKFSPLKAIKADVAWRNGLRLWHRIFGAIVVRPILKYIEKQETV